MTTWDRLQARKKAIEAKDKRLFSVSRCPAREKMTPEQVRLLAEWNEVCAKLIEILPPSKSNRDVVHYEQAEEDGW